MLPQGKNVSNTVYGLCLTGGFVSQSACSFHFVPRERPFLELARAAAAASPLGRIPL
jgi:hypothetical protein